MNALMRISRGVRGVRACALGLAVPAVLSLALVDAEAAAIHRHGAEPRLAHPGGIPAAEMVVFDHWSRYLLAGPSVWAHVDHPLWDQTVRSAVWASIRTDPGPADPMINFLMWKQSLDPPRFAHYHPGLAPALHRIRMARSSPTSLPQVGPTTTASGGGGSGGTSSSPSTPSVPATGPTTAQDNLIPPTVPEPSMLLVAAGMTAWLFLRAHRRT